jgi:hypothetical protein
MRDGKRQQKAEGKYKRGHEKSNTDEGAETKAQLSDMKRPIKAVKGSLQKESTRTEAT